MTAHCLAIHNRKLLLMLRDNNPEIKDPNKWGLIGGVGEKDETPEQTLLREFEEETCVRPNTYNYIMNFGDKHLFSVSLTDEEVSQLRIGNEGQKLGFFSLDELFQIPVAGKFGQGLEKYRTLLSQYID